MTSREENPSSPEELSKKLNMILDQLDALEAAVLEDPKYKELASILHFARAGVGLYADPLKLVANSKLEDSLRRGGKANIEAKLLLKASEVRAGEDIDVEMELRNAGNAAASLVRIEGLPPANFELVTEPDRSFYTGSYIDMDGKKLEPSMRDEIRFVLRSFNEGVSTIKPKIIYVNAAGEQITCEPEPVTVEVQKTVLPDRVSTGYNDLDSLLFGGIPLNYAVILTSPPCDEKDLLVHRFLEAGLKKRETTFYISTEASGVKTLAEKNQSVFTLFVCNPQADKIIRNLSNVFKLKGVENLTEISISLTKASRELAKPSHEARRACVEIISDVLLRHGAVQARRWLTDLITELKSKGFTTLAVVNPQMHSPQEVQAILDLFEGEIGIYEKDAVKLLKIKRMYNQEYLDSELRLRKDRLRISKAES